MSSEDRATAFVRRADASLRDLDRANEVWTASVRSTSEEIRLHGLPLKMDDAIRRVKGSFDAWANLDPAQVEAVREQGPIHLLWVVSCHPSGRVREAFVHQTKHVESERILPHLANRSVDFVAPIRDLAAPLVIARLDEVLDDYSDPDHPGPLPTPIHITVNKLLNPQTGTVSPLLLHRCIDVAIAAAMPQPRSLRGGGMARMLDRCHRSLASVTDSESSAAIEALITYFNQPPR